MITNIPLHNLQAIQQVRRLQDREICVLLRPELFQSSSQIPKQSLHQWIIGAVLINDTLLLGSISFLQQADGLQNMLIGKGLQISGVTDDGPFDFTKKMAEMLARFIELLSP